MSQERFFTCEIDRGALVTIPLAYADRPGIEVAGATLRANGPSIPWARVGNPPRLSAADLWVGDPVEFTLRYAYPLDSFQNQSWYGVVLEKGEYYVTLERCPDAASALRRATALLREEQLNR